MIDAPAPGSGELFDWSLLGEVPEGPRLILAGGLDPDNVARAVCRVGPCGVDVSSGVEKAPGLKDPMKVKAFIERARAAAPQQHLGPDSMPYDWADDEEEMMALMAEPSATGRFGEFGGRFVPETLVPACQELEEAFREAWADSTFREELAYQLRQYAGRPSILTECVNLGTQLGIRLLLKREDLNHTGSHKINNVLGQALLAKRMGKTRLVAETG